MSQERARILAIDDTPANLMTLGAVLAQDFDLQIATSGVAGLELARETSPDLILLDIMMPEMDGYEVCRHLQADPRTRDIPIIFVTALNSPEEETRGLEAGAVDYISKPVNPVVVRARVRTHLTLKHQADLLRSMAFQDGLTGIANRRRFDETLDNEWRFCRRSHISLSLIMIDIDLFKQYNDRYGHLAGDACLQAVAGALNLRMGRSHDLVARYGGEEFVCLLPGTTLDGALILAESLREAVQALGIRHQASTASEVVTISLGVATVVPNGQLSPDLLVAAADGQLYAAKRAGRNRVQHRAMQ
jgi:diguanylate cyclase (GGDEF)-like protein